MKKRVLLTFSLLLSGLFFYNTAFGQALSGSYTIGSGGSYSTFTAAVADLTSNGVSGPVTFNVISGTYTEQISIGSISGASSTNTITFQS